MDRLMGLLEQSISSLHMKGNLKMERWMGLAKVFGKKDNKIRKK